MDDKSLAAFAIFQLLKQCFNVSQPFPNEINSLLFW